MKVCIDIDKLNKDKHQYLKQVFNFPDFYGENLHALYDLLAEKKKIKIKIKNYDLLNDFSNKILQVINDVNQKYHNIKLIIN